MHTVKGFEVAIVVMSESNPIVARRETLAQKGLLTLNLVLRGVSGDVLKGIKGASQ